jgi:hypothetical protein
MPTPFSGHFAHYAALSTNACKTRRKLLQGWINHLVMARKKILEEKQIRIPPYFHFSEKDLCQLKDIRNEEGTPCAQIIEIDCIIELNKSRNKDYNKVSLLHDELKEAQKLLHDKQKLFEDQKEGIESMIQQRERELELLNQKLQQIQETESKISVQINDEKEKRAPPEFSDVFGCEIMDDPVVASDGFTYNRKNFVGWLNMGKQVSPTTNALLVSQNVFPNYSLKSRIEEWRDAFERDKPVPEPKKKINSELKERCKWIGFGFLICAVISIPIFCFLGLR